MSAPRTLIDIKTSRTNVFTRLAKRVNLVNPITRLFVRGPLKLVLLSFLLFSFVVGLAVAPTYYPATAAVQNEQERAELERQLMDLEKQITDYENTISSYQKQGKSLKGDIGALQAKIDKLNAQVKAINISLDKLTKEIVENQDEITETENKLARNREAISRSLQYVYESEQQSLMLVLLKNPTLSGFSGALNDLLDVQDGILVAVAESVKLKNELEEEKENLELKKSDALAFKAYQDAQRKATQSLKQEKDSLLAQTKGQESKYKDLLKATKKSAAEIRNRLFEFLGGGQMTFEEAYNFAKIAERATGVRAALTLAVLDHESALGSNIGRCSYKTAMSPGVPAKAGKRDDISIFLKLMSDLGLNPDLVLVSCANSDGAFGGAMGPAQFIPSTWKLYSPRIAEITGAAIPNPLTNGHAIIGTSLYLKDALSACSAYNGTAKERCAAARYYAGGRWKSYLFTYGDRVVTKAAQFQQDIDEISS